MDRASFFRDRGRGHKDDPVEVRARMPGLHVLKSKRALAATLPLSTSNGKFLQPSAGGPGIQDQKNVGACEGYAHSSAITLRMAIRGTPIQRVSAVGLYQSALMLQRVPNADGTLPSLSDDGTEPNLIVRAIQTYGACSEETWGGSPPTPESIIVQPSVAQLEAAGTFTLQGAYAIQSTGDQYLRDLMTAFAGGYPVTGAIAASSAAFNDYTGGVLPALDSQVDHATMWIDYTWDGKNLGSLVVIGVNSWGDGQEGDPAWGESDAPGISAGMYRCDASFLRAYSSSSYVLDVAPAAGSVES